MYPNGDDIRNKCDVLGQPIAEADGLKCPGIAGWD